jgi:hypothetical protein
MTLRNISLNLELGQIILVGQNNEPATITKIEFHEKTGEGKHLHFGYANNMNTIITTILQTNTDKYFYETK